MNPNTISPYIRRAIHSDVPIPWLISMRILFEYELIYLEKGYLEITVDDRLYHLSPGDVILFCPGQPHEIRSAGTEKISQPHILFDLEYDQYSDRIPISFRNIDAFSEEEKRMIRINAFSNLESPLLKIDHPEHFLSLFYDVIDTWEAGKDLYMLECKHKMIRLLLYLFKCNPSMVMQKQSVPLPSLESVRDYIDNNFTNTITLDTLSDMFHINKFHLTRRFREEFGLPVIQYHKKVLADAAKKLLLEKHSVTQTAQLLGFESIYAFSRFFKNVIGVSPSQYVSAMEKERSIPSAVELWPIEQ